MKNDRLDEEQTGITIARRTSNNFRYTDDTTLMTESEEGKSWLKAQHSENEDHGIRSHHLMGNSWGNSGNNVRL